MSEVKLKVLYRILENKFHALVGKFSKFLILVLLMRQLMHRGCDLPLCCMRYHQACKMSLDQNVNVLSAPLGMTHTQQDTWHWVMEARGMQSLCGSRKFLLIWCGTGCIKQWSGWGHSAICATVSETHDPNSGCWLLLLHLGWSLLPLAYTRECNRLHHSISLRTTTTTTTN